MGTIQSESHAKLRLCHINFDGCRDQNFGIGRPVAPTPPLLVLASRSTNLQHVSCRQCLMVD